VQPATAISAECHQQSMLPCNISYASSASSIVCTIEAFATLAPCSHRCNRAHSDAFFARPLTAGTAVHPMRAAVRGARACVRMLTRHGMPVGCELPPTSASGLGSPLRKSASGLRPFAATSARGWGLPVSLLRRDWAHPAHICTGTALTPPTSAPGLRSPRPHLRQDLAGQMVLRASFVTPGAWVCGF
jgi:hypothetical protein